MVKKQTPPHVSCPVPIVFATITCVRETSYVTAIFPENVFGNGLGDVMLICKSFLIGYLFQVLWFLYYLLHKLNSTAVPVIQLEC